MPIQTPICDFGQKAHDFKLKSTDGKILSLADVTGEKGTLIMFICNHCPYVKAIIEELVSDCNDLKSKGVNSVAIMSNDTKNYPEDSFENMILFSKKNKFNFPYLFDETQEVAKSYGAVCTPDFFGYGLEFDGLQYRGRIRKLKNLQPIYSNKEGNKKNIKDISELRLAMEKIALTGKGPKKQVPSMGCNIKWFNK